MTAFPRQNNLLAWLPAETPSNCSQLRSTPLKNRQMLQRHGETPPRRVFSNRSICALMMPMSDELTPEIARGGAEG